MKHYEKPTVEIYSLCGNETICGGCSQKLRDDAVLNKQVAWAVFDPDEKLTEDEAKGLFGLEENCEKGVDVYCKFTGTVSGLSWS